MSYVSTAVAHLRAGFEGRGGLCLSVFHAFGENLQITIQIVISAWWIRQDAGRGRTRLPSNTQTFHRQWHRFLTIRRIFLYPNLPRDMKTALQKITKKQQILILMILRYRYTPSAGARRRHRISRARCPYYPKQDDIDDLIREMALTKSNAELLISRLSQWDLLDGSVQVTSQRWRHSGFSGFFRLSDGLCFCHDVRGLFNAMGIPCNVPDWRLFIDSSCRSLKAVLLHNTNKWPSIPLAHSVHMSENYDNVKVSYIHIELI